MGWFAYKRKPGCLDWCKCYYGCLVYIPLLLVLALVGYMIYVFVTADTNVPFFETREARLREVSFDPLIQW